MDTDGDGEISPEEFEKGCEKLNIPLERAKELFDEIDLDYSGGISPEEWDEAMGLKKDDIRRTVLEKLGKLSDMIDQVDTDGDGKASAEEIEQALKDAGVSDEEAEEIARELDPDGKGVTQEEWMEESGAKDIARERYSSPETEADKKKTEDAKREAKEKLKDAFKSGKDAWEKIGDGKAKSE